MKEYLNARGVWKAFRASGRRHLILTGSRQTGKSTLFSQLIPEEAPGILTHAVPGSAVWLKNTLIGECARIGVYDPSLPGNERKMIPDQNGFISVGIPAAEHFAVQTGDWAGIDEIGYLESACVEYCEALRRLMNEKRVIAVVRKSGSVFTEEILCRDDVFAVDLDDPYGKAGCVIMASGLGKRFSPDGSVNKLTADFLGKPLIHHVLDTTDGMFCRRVVVTRHRDAAGLCKKQKTDVILHDLPHRSDTVRLGTGAMVDTDCCLFCQGDQPLIDRDTISAMLLLSRHDREAIIRAAWDHTAASPVLFPRWAYEELMNLPEGKGGGWLAKKYPDRVKNLNVFHPAELMDADTPSDLEELERIFREELA